MKKVFLCVNLLIMLTVLCYAIRIPLDGSGAGTAQSGGSVRIGIIDIEMIFREFPETRRGKSELEKEIQAAHAEIEKKQDEIDLLQQEVDEMNAVEEKTGSLPGMKLKENTTAQVTTDTTEEELEQIAKKTEEEDSKEFKKLLESKNELLAKKKEEIEKFRKESEINLLASEERRSRNILEKLYKALEKIGREENLDIILDKNYVLYGSPVIDVTEKLRKRLAGD